MTSLGAALDAQRVRALFAELSERLQARRAQAQLFVVGGAAMALEYDQDRLTRDVDAHPRAGCAGDRRGDQRLPRSGA